MAEISITANDRRSGPYTATAGQTVFDYDFPVYANTELEVTYTPAATGIDQTLVLTTEYTVTGVGAEAGGTVVLVTPAAVGDQVVIEGQQPIQRISDFQEAGDFLAVVLNKEMDRVVMMIQEFARDDGRRVQLPVSDPVANMILPKKADRASLFFAFDAAGEPLASPGPVGGLAVSAYIATLIDDADAATAQSTLGGTTVGKALFTAASAAAGRTALALGTLATLNGIDNFLPPSLWGGGSFALDTDTDHDLLFQPFRGMNTTFATNLILAAAQTKQLDAEYASGDDAGGLGRAPDISADTTISFVNGTSKIVDGASAGTKFANIAVNDQVIVRGSTSNDGNFTVTAVAANDITVSPAPTTEGAGASVTITVIKASWLFNVFAVDDGAGGVEIGFDDSLTAAGLLARTGGTLYRCFGYFETDASANIDSASLTWIGDGFRKRYYTASGTWRKNAMLNFVDWEGLGAGAGGEGGQSAATGGGVGGGPGTYGVLRTKAATLGATEALTVGTGGAGSAAATTPAAGGDGGATSIGSHMTCPGGSGSNGTSGGVAGAAATGADFYIQGQNGLGRNGSDPIGGTGGAPAMYGTGDIADFAADDTARATANYGGGGRGGWSTGIVSGTDAGQDGAGGLIIATEHFA